MHPSHFRGATAPTYALQDAGLPQSRPAAWAKGLALMLSLAAAQVFAQAPGTPDASSGAALAGGSCGQVYDLLIGTLYGQREERRHLRLSFRYRQRRTVTHRVGADGESVVSRRER